MTEEEWLAYAEPDTMLWHLLGKMSHRKLRLFACACCRRLWDMLPVACRQGIEVAERFADSLATDEDCQTAFDRVEAVQTADTQQRGQRRQPNALSRALSAVYDACSPRAMTIRTALSSARAATYAVGAAAGVAAPAEDYEHTYDGARLQEALEQARLVRELFGNPFKPVTMLQEWRTDTVLALGRQIYESRDFSAMPILADAMQDAGSEHTDILDHCRDPNQVHVRGCWVVDLVLGKE
jgi:hypothetical protein